MQTLKYKNKDRKERRKKAGFYSFPFQHKMWADKQGIGLNLAIL